MRSSLALYNLKFGIKRILLLTVLLFIAVSLNAQYNKGLVFYEQFNYYKAIDKFKKVKETNKDFINAQIKIADSYRMVRDFEKSAAHYKAAISLGVTDATVHYNYGSVLKSINNYDEAVKEIHVYIKENPTDKRASNAANIYQIMEEALNRPNEYFVKNLKSINTSKSEFCPVAYDKGIVFVAVQKNDLSSPDLFPGKKIPYLNVYYSEIKNDTMFAQASSFSSKINGEFHEGPIAFSQDLNLAFLTQSGGKKTSTKASQTNKPKIVSFVKNKKSWTTKTVLPFVNSEYSYAHPSLSADGKFLFFSSDMPGGFGGMDLWMSKKEGETWTEPVNLGAGVNTAGNEEFPYIRKDNRLFFSSDGLPGFGGLDIFSAQLRNVNWKLIRNEGVGINSAGDDFGINFVDEEKGYFSSNRMDGLGEDDIYSFVFKSSFICVEGNVYLAKNKTEPLKNAKVILEDINGNDLDTLITTETGYFNFSNLEAGNYSVNVQEDDTNLPNIRKYYYAEKDGTVTRVTSINVLGDKFVFMNLPSDGKPLQEIEESDVNLFGTFVSGKDPSNPIANAQVILYDSDGKIVDKTTTNCFGSFGFKNKLPSNGFKMELIIPDDNNLPEGTPIILTNKNGKAIKEFLSTLAKRYKLDQLSAEQAEMKEMYVDDTELLMDVSGKLLNPKKECITGAKVNLLNKSGETIQTTQTDKTGKFNFQRLKPNGDYSLFLDENDAALNGYDHVYLTTAEGVMVKKMVKEFKKGFKYNVLSNEDALLKDFYVDDPWLNVINFDKKEITIAEHVYYNTGEYKPDDAAKKIFDKIILILKNDPTISVEIGSHTDANGNDAANMTLSKKRSQSSADYFISHGIAAKRVKGIGYGETRLINKCSNKVECTEEEHKQNRRTDFRIFKLE